MYCVNDIRKISLLTNWFTIFSKSEVVDTRMCLPLDCFTSVTESNCFCAFLNNPRHFPTLTWDSDVNAECVFCCSV